MSVVTGALGSLVPKLLQLLRDEYKLQKGVRKQVQWLHDELESIHAFLTKVSDVPWNQLDEQVKVWARKVRDASYDIEDILDTFLVRVDGEPADPRRLKGAVKKVCKMFSKAKARRSIAHDIQYIKKQLEDIAERRQKYKLDEIMCRPQDKLDEIMCRPQATTSGIDPRLAAMYKEVDKLIGIDKSRDKLMSMLNPSHPDDDAPDKKITRKVSVVGVGGLGKTTLAKAVYDNLKSQYDCAAFVSVGRDLDLVKVFKDILFQLDKKKYENIHNTGRGVDLLISELREFLHNKRYFVVIDDVWEVQTWKEIKPALIENTCGSKVITTTRKLDVAKEASDVYKLEPLSNDDSMKLFYTRIHGKEGKYLGNHPDDVFDKIIKKCDGIPLAIITLASLLASKPMLEWSDILNSIGFGLKDNREAVDTMKILSFSYYDLPPQLRTCLLYLSTYPEDYLILKDSLIWKWIAEGFINGKQRERLFELGEIYFNDLINRSLIQAETRTEYGIVFGCRVHDMVLDLIRNLSIEENFIVLLGDNVEGTPVTSSIRRIAIQYTTVEHLNSDATDTGIPKVRSYTAFMCCINRVQFLRFNLLRVLDISECNFEEDCHLEHLGDLLHLRYLRITSEGSAPELPNQIGNLKLLQTLDVDGTLPASTAQLTELVSLRSQNSVPDGLGRLVSLEELIIFSPFSEMPERFLKELGSLRELRVLQFGTFSMDESMQRDFVESLSNLKKIQDLILPGFVLKADTAMWEAAGFVLPRSLRDLRLFVFEFSKLPSCINPSRLPNLSRLLLAVTSMEEQDLKRIARLPSLTYLDLTTWCTLTTRSINAGDDFFHKLRYFEINTMVQFEQPDEEDASVSLHIWARSAEKPFGSRKNNRSKVVPSSVMPNLERLRLHASPRALKDNNGDFINIGLEYLPSLREVGGDFFSGGVSPEVEDAAWEALRNECKIHRNNPTLKMRKRTSSRVQPKDNNVSKEEEEDEKQQEEAEEASHTVDVDVGKLSLASS